MQAAETCSVCGTVYEYRRGYRHGMCPACTSRQRREMERGPGKTAFEAYIDLAGAVIHKAIEDKDFEFLRTTGRNWARILESDMEAYEEKINDLECAVYRRRVEYYLRMASKPAK